MCGEAQVRLSGRGPIENPPQPASLPYMALRLGGRGPIANRPQVANLPYEAAVVAGLRSRSTMAWKSFDRTALRRGARVI